MSEKPNRQHLRGFYQSKKAELKAARNDYLRADRAARELSAAKRACREDLFKRLQKGERVPIGELLSTDCSEVAELNAVAIEKGLRLDAVSRELA